MSLPALSPSPEENNKLPLDHTTLCARCLNRPAGVSTGSWTSVVTGWCSAPAPPPVFFWKRGAFETEREQKGRCLRVREKNLLHSYQCDTSKQLDVGSDKKRWEEREGWGTEPQDMWYFKPILILEKDYGMKADKLLLDSLRFCFHWELCPGCFLIYLTNFFSNIFTNFSLLQVKDKYKVWSAKIKTITKRTMRTPAQIQINNNLSYNKNLQYEQSRKSLHHNIRETSGSTQFR